ncbi:MAG: lysophospholipid acyltransferase family protein [FCB group bacterium]|jgi:KDO2-lipid IV(A) lauroyltransferase|nr:lysophospholipid acyltransferase family protein [FCB group bacterium]
MAGLGKRAVRRATAIATVAFAGITKALPLPVARSVGKLLGRIAYHLVPRVRRDAYANIDTAYGETLTSAEKRRILLHATENLGIVAAEFSHIPEIPKLLESGAITVEGFDLLDRSKGIMFAGAHLGNWEWMAPLLTALGLNVAEVVRPLNDELLNRLVDRTRQSLGTVTLGKANAGNELLRLLKEGWVSGVLADQSPTSSAVPVTYFGRPCWATIAPVMVALRAKIPVHPICMVRQPNGDYRLIISPPLTFTRTGNLHADLVENSQLVQDAIETLVRAYPGQWLWLHRRWKPRPRLEQEWQARTNKPSHKQSENGDCSTFDE